MPHDPLMSRLDEQRARSGFLSIDALLGLVEEGNQIFDPFSTLISTYAKIGKGNVIYPNVIILCQSESEISIGNHNIIYPSSMFLAENGGSIKIGSMNQFGEGGVSIKANTKGSRLVFEDNGRYINGIQVIGTCKFGSGSQVIGGYMTVQDCTLLSGEDFSNPDPDERAGVIKGYGLARGLIVGKGEVINGSGVFYQSNIERQSLYHPKIKIDS